MSEPDQNFLSRWSRRKAQVRQGGAPEPVAPCAPATPVAAAVQPLVVPVTRAADEPAAAALPVAAPCPTVAPEPKPTVEDVQALTPESDFSRFVARDVDPEVKNLAMKKLFADPHFNVMDGLDTYIDDYNTPDPIPKSMFKQLVQARMLGLLDDELEDQIPPATMPAAAGELALDEQATPVPVSPAVETASLPGEAGVEAMPMADARQATAESTPGGRAWESNPPGTA